MYTAVDIRFIGYAICRDVGEISRDVIVIYAISVVSLCSMQQRQRQRIPVHVHGPGALGGCSDQLQ